MYTFDYIRAYGHMIGASAQAVNRMVARADGAEIDLALEPVWFVEGDGWKYTTNLSKTIREEIQAWVDERGGRSDEFILTRDIYGAAEVDKERTFEDGSGITRNWAEALCADNGWSDPSNIVWAATFSINLGFPNERHCVIVQTGDAGVQVYVNCPDGSGWTIDSPVVIATY